MDGVQILGTEKISRLFWRMVIPTVISQVVTLLYNIIDRVFIGHIPEVGSLALTGVGVAMPITMLLSAFARLGGVGGAARVSFYLGRRDLRSAEITLGSCTLFLIIISVVVTIIVRLFSGDILIAFGSGENTLVFAKEYLDIYILGTIFVEMATGLALFITAQGFTRVSLIAIIFGAGLNTILDPIFIFVFGLGVRGAAIATVISQAVSTVWVLHFLTGKRTEVKIKPEMLRFRRKYLMPALALGCSPFVMSATESLLNIIFNRSLLQYGGETAVGVMTIFSTIRSFVIFPLMGIGQGVQPIISFNYGADRWDRIRRTMVMAIVVGMIFSVSMWLVIMLMPSTLVRIFTTSDTMISYANIMAGWFFALLFIMGIQVITQNFFLALGNAKTSLFLALFRKIIILIPLILLLPCIMPDQEKAVFLAEPVADTIAALTTAVIFLRHYGRQLKEKR